MYINNGKQRNTDKENEQSWLQDNKGIVKDVIQSIQATKLSLYVSFNYHHRSRALMEWNGIIYSPSLPRNVASLTQNIWERKHMIMYLVPTGLFPLSQLAMKIAFGPIQRATCEKRRHGPVV
ncbi:uncharacterized protein LOC107609667 isoform X1 [Arachis ipaensis]|uniref:uncharacterized protein LOC107609667 isoform X1 n=1 Tax=Arachis ipaensis TaxID=130454 RepID=UPI000A2B73EA|nr:uncharacterized protein LOC107609667 isoform X1 [Arachis ipaensis]